MYDRLLWTNTLTTHHARKATNDRNIHNYGEVQQVLAPIQSTCNNTCLTLILHTSIELYCIPLQYFSRLVHVCSKQPQYNPLVTEEITTFLYKIYEESVIPPMLVHNIY